MVNRAFINYFDNLTNSLKFPIWLNWITYNQTLPIFLHSFDFNPNFLNSPNTLKDFVYQFQHKKEVFNIKKRHNINGLELAKKNSFFNTHTADVFLFATAIILLLVT